MPFAFLEHKLAELEKSGLLRQARLVTGPQGPHIRLAGRKLLNFSSNNYLGLANHPDLATAASAAGATAGSGSGASRLIVGDLEAHRELELSLALFLEAPAALLFNSGYHANTGILSAISGAEDHLFSDQLNHASLIDGCRLGRATTHVFPHRDIENLEELLKKPCRRRFIVSDSLFSMNGDVQRLTDLRALADQYSAVLLLDEAHAVGVCGPRGRGLAAQYQITADIHVGTLGKAFGSFGAYVAGPAPLIQYLRNRSRSFVFTTALPPSIAAASLAALRIITSEQGDQLRARLDRNIDRFASGLCELRLREPDTGQGANAIFPILVGPPGKTMTITDHLIRAGVYAQGIRPPTVPEGTSRLRFTLMATHASAHIDQALTALADLVGDGTLEPLS